MGVYIFKRKSYGLAEMAMKGAKGMNPVSSIVQDTMDNAVTKPIEFANQEAKNYQPTVVNAYAPNQGNGTEVQKQYGIAGTLYGAGKGLLKYGKQNAGTMLGAAGFGAGLSGVSYGYNRYQADKAEIENGTRNEQGLSTNEKVAMTGVGAGLAAGAGIKSAINHDNAVKKASEALQKNSRTIQAQSGVNSTMLRNAVNRRNDAAKTLQTLNRDRLGGLVSNKTFKAGRNALIAAGITAGAALLANAGLKRASQNKYQNTQQNQDNNQNSAIQSQYSQVDGFSGVRKKYIYRPVRKGYEKLSNGVSKLKESMYAVPVVGSALGRLVKSKLAGGVNALGKAGNLAAQQSYGQLLKQNIQNGTWNNIGSAAGTAISGGAQQLIKGAGNMFTLGRADKLINRVASGMKEHGGETGAKAAQFLRNHKTLATAATGATVGGAMFDVANKVGEKSVNAITSLDTKTSNFKKNQELQYQLNQQNQNQSQ